MMEQACRALCDGVLRQERRAIARALTLVEEGKAAAQEIIAALFPRSGRAHLIGITGAPGAGKSTLIKVLATAFRARGSTVGIIAVDPTSPFSGGAILGDRIRMQEAAGRWRPDPGIFIRSMASRGSLGGLARATTDAIQVLDAAGFDTIIVETVGAGQAEVDVARAVHTTLVLQVPGMGDDIQAIKAGILEIADIIVVNKADRDGADEMVATLDAMLDLAPQTTETMWQHATTLGGAMFTASPVAVEPRARWRPPVVKTIATKGEGVDDLMAAISRHLAFLRESGLWAARERARLADELCRQLGDTVLRRFAARMPARLLSEVMTRLQAREINLYAAVQQLLRAAEGSNVG